MIKSALMLWVRICTAMSSRYFPGRVLGRFKGASSGRTPLCAPPSEAKWHDTHGQEAPQATWLGDSVAGEPPTVGAARSQVSKEGLFKRKWEETLLLPHSWTSETPTAWLGTW